MFKQLGIAAVCGLALYGLTKLISQQVTVVAHGPGQTPEPFDASPDLPENATSPDEAGQLDARDPTALPAEEGGAATETQCASASQAQHSSDKTQAAPCP